MLVYILTTLYLICGVIDMIAYWPTIDELRKGKPAASVRSYWVWSLTSFVGVLYAGIVIKDLPLFLVLGVDLIACTTILVLRLRLKRKVPRSMFEEPK